MNNLIKQINESNISYLKGFKQGIENRNDFSDKEKGYYLDLINKKYIQLKYKK